MRFIHLADLHLGKKIANYSLYDDQEEILRKIIKQAEKFKPDCFLISGDIFDRSLPGEEAVGLYDTFITQCAGIAPVYMIAGNHDSGKRLELFKKPLEQAEIYIEGVYKGNLVKKTAEIGDERVNIYMLPYFNPTEVHYIKGEQVKNYEQALDLILKDLKLNPDEINILLSHQYFTDRKKDPDDDSLEIGNLEEIGTEKIKDFDYVALGHLHRSQKVGSERIRYCGSPLKYSVKDYKKVLNCVKMDKENIRVDQIELKPERDIRVIRDSFENLISQDEGSEDFVIIELTDKKYFPNVKASLLKKFPNLIQIKFNIDQIDEESSYEYFLGKEPIELLEQFFKSKGYSLDSEETELAQEIFNELKEEDNYEAALS